MLICLVLLAWPLPTRAAQPPSREDAILFEADLLTYDRERRIVEATGNVQARQTGRTLYADTLIYDEIENRITARGNVKLVEPNGDVLQADTFEITGDFKEAVADHIRAVFADGSRVTGTKGRRTQGIETTIDKATYTACFACPDNPDATPIWQVKAVRVTHNQLDRVIQFDNAWVELGGVPVMYTPYFSRPDPRVERKTGLLAPTFGSQSDLGLLTRIPFFWAITENQDVTITPWITTQAYPVLQGQYRGAFAHGNIQADGSITRDVEGETGGHIFASAQYDIDENWRAGLDAQRTTYRTYLRQYGFGGMRTLVSRLYGENFTDRDYFAANAYAFQNLDKGSKQETIPFVAPMLDYFYAGQQDGLGGRTNVHLNGVVLTRENGINTRRMSARAQWDRPFTGPIGDIYTLSAALWGDGYQVEDLELNGTSNYSGFQGRLFPTGALTWSMPFVRNQGIIQQTIEPTVQFVAAPRYGNPNRIPDEDSQDFELQTTNLFGLNPSPGIDRVLEGPRVNYGMRWHGYGPSDANASIFLGQSYLFFDEDTFGPNTGYEGNLSDFVSSVMIQPRKYLWLMYRNRVDPQDLSFKTNEVVAWTGVEALNFVTGYNQIEAQPAKALFAREEMIGIANARLSRYWRTQGTAVRDIQLGAWRSYGLDLIYEDECFLFSAGYLRRNYNDEGLNPQNVFLFRVWLKTLGDFGAGIKAASAGSS